MVMLWRSFESLIRLMSLSINQIASWFAFKFCYLNAPTKKVCIFWYKDGKVYSKDSIKSKYLTNFQYFPIKFKFNHSASKNWFRGTITNVAISISFVSRRWAEDQYSQIEFSSHQLYTKNIRYRKSILRDSYIKLIYKIG